MKIIPDEELLTLITCHPYTKNYQRYVVYCRRTGIAETDRGGQQEDPLLAVTGEDYESSRGRYPYGETSEFYGAGHPGSAGCADATAEMKRT